MKINFQGKDESMPLLEAILSFEVKETDESTMRTMCIETIVSGVLQVAGKEYAIKCRHFYDADRLCFYTHEAVDGIVRKYKSDIKYFFSDALINNFDFSMAQEKGHLVLVDGERWQKKEDRHDFKVIEEGSCIACGRL